MRKYLYFFIILQWSLSLLSCFQDSVKEHNYMLKLNLQGKKYNQLWLRTEYLTLQKPYSDGITPVTLAWEIEGKSDDGYHWIFPISDSIYEKSEKEFIVKTQPFNFESRKEGLMLFSMKDREASIGAIVFDGKEFDISAKYRKTVIDDRKKDDESFAYILTDTFALAPIFEYDIFEIESVTKDSNIDIYLNFPEFEKIPDTDYADELQKRIDWVKKYSGSKSLFYRFTTMSSGYKSREDMKLVLDNFSDSLKSSANGIRVKEYLSETIKPIALDTLHLLNTETKSEEPVIKNRAAYTLVLFSASWCSPCHEQIPLLKKIYADLGKKLDIVYISIDNEGEMYLWENLMEKEAVPWRSLFASEKYKGLSANYSIKGIPFSLLIHPGGSEEQMDVRLSRDKDKLYAYVKQPPAEQVDLLEE